MIDLLKVVLIYENFIYLFISLYLNNIQNSIRLYIEFNLFSLGSLISYKILSIYYISINNKIFKLQTNVQVFVKEILKNDVYNK